MSTAFQHCRIHGRRLQKKAYTQLSYSGCLFSLLGYYGPSAFSGCVTPAVNSAEHNTGALRKDWSQHQSPRFHQASGLPQTPTIPCSNRLEARMGAFPPSSFLVRFHPP